MEMGISPSLMSINREIPFFLLVELGVVLLLRVVEHLHGDNGHGAQDGSDDQVLLDGGVVQVPQLGLVGTGRGNLLRSAQLERGQG